MRIGWLGISVLVIRDRRYAEGRESRGRGGGGGVSRRKSYAAFGGWGGGRRTVGECSSAMDAMSRLRRGGAASANGRWRSSVGPWPVIGFVWFHGCHHCCPVSAAGICRSTRILIASMIRCTSRSHHQRHHVYACDYTVRVRVLKIVTVLSSDLLVSSGSEHAVDRLFGIWVLGRCNSTPLSMPTPMPTPTPTPTPTHADTTATPTPTPHL